METHSTHNTLLTTIVVLLVVIAIVLLAGKGGRMISYPYGTYSYYGASAINGMYLGQQPLYYPQGGYQSVTAYSRPSQPISSDYTTNREIISTTYQYLYETPQYTYSCDGTYCWTNQ